jgi:hypothetical protein
MRIRSGAAVSLQILALLFACVFVTGCAPRKLPALWETHTISIAPTESQELLTRLAKQGSELRTYRALFTTTLQRGRESASFRQAVVFERPDKLRIEALPPQGALSLDLLIARDGIVTALVPPEKQAQRGPSSTGLFRRYLDLPFRESEIMALVSGGLEDGVLAQGAEVRCGDNDCIALRSDGRYRWRFKRDSGLLAEVSMRDALKLRERVIVRYGDYRAVNGRMLPGVITLQLPEDEVKVTMAATMLAAEQSINPRVFDVAIPSDYSIQE